MNLKTRSTIEDDGADSDDAEELLPVMNAALTSVGPSKLSGRKPSASCGFITCGIVLIYGCDEREGMAVVEVTAEDAEDRTKCWQMEMGNPPWRPLM